MEECVRVVVVEETLWWEFVRAFAVGAALVSGAGIGLLAGAALLRLIGWEL